MKILTKLKDVAKVAVICPFHDEKTGSMILNFSSDTYHCLGCGKQGVMSTVIVLHEDNDKSAGLMISERTA